MKTGKKIKDLIILLDGMPGENVGEPK